MCVIRRNRHCSTKARQSQTNFRLIEKYLPIESVEFLFYSTNWNYLICEYAFNMQSTEMEKNLTRLYHCNETFHLQVVLSKIRMNEGHKMWERHKFIMQNAFGNCESFELHSNGQSFGWCRQSEMRKWKWIIVIRNSNA